MMWYKRSTRICFHQEKFNPLYHYGRGDFLCGFCAETVLNHGGFEGHLFATLMVDRGNPGTKLWR